MRTEIMIRRDIELEDFYDAYENWGIQLTADTKALEIIGTPVKYEYQFNSSNERTVIFARDSDGKVVRKCSEIELNVFMSQSTFDGNSTIEERWDSFIDYISGYVIELAFGVGQMRNKYTLESELNPTIVYDHDGSIKILTCGIKLKQVNSYNARF